MRSLKVINLSDEEINSLDKYERVVMMMDALQEGYDVIFWIPRTIRGTSGLGKKPQDSVIRSF